MDCGVVRRSVSVVRFLLDVVRSCPHTNGNNTPKHNPATIRIRNAVVQLPQRCRSVFIPSVFDLGLFPNDIAVVDVIHRIRKAGTGGCSDCLHCWVKPEGPFHSN